MMSHLQLFGIAAENLPHWQALQVLFLCTCFVIYSCFPKNVATLIFNNTLGYIVSPVLEKQAYLLYLPENQHLLFKDYIFEALPPILLLSEDNIPVEAYFHQIFFSLKSLCLHHIFSFKNQCVYIRYFLFKVCIYFMNPADYIFSFQSQCLQCKLQCALWDWVFLFDFNYFQPAKWPFRNPLSLQSEKLDGWKLIFREAGAGFSYFGGKVFRQADECVPNFCSLLQPDLLISAPLTS